MPKIEQNYKLSDEEYLAIIELLSRNGIEATRPDVIRFIEKKASFTQDIYALARRTVLVFEGGWPEGAVWLKSVMFNLTILSGLVIVILGVTLPDVFVSQINRLKLVPPQFLSAKGLGASLVVEGSVIAISPFIYQGVILLKFERIAKRCNLNKRRKSEY